MILVHTLGTTSIEVDSCIITPASPRKFALLLYLTAERGRRIPREVVQDFIFPDQADRNGRHSLRELIYQLRQIEVEIESSPDGMGLSASRVRFDYDELFEATTLETAQLRPATGGFLPGFAPPFLGAYVEWLDDYRARSIAALSRTFLREVTRARNGGDWERTEVAATACLAIDPLNETATFALAEMLFLGGAKAKATKLLDQYADEVGKVSSDLKISAKALRRRMDQAHETTPSRLTPRFVGRVEEMKLLRAVLRRASSGKVQCVAISGEPGIGKSRLLAEFRSIIELEGVRCETVTMQPHDAIRPMGAFVDLVPCLLRLPGALGCAPESMQALRRLTSSPTSTFPEQRDTLELDAIAFAVTAAICDVCESIACESPLVLTIDDAHSLDQLSTNVLSALMSMQRRGRILLLIATREPRSILRSLRHTDGVTSLPLRPLPTEATGSLIDDVLSTLGPPPSAARERLLDAANGNPLFALTLASHFRDRRDATDAPATLIELLGRRLDPLSTMALSILATCIAFGKHCTTNRLLRALELPPALLLENLEALAELGLLNAHSDVASAAHPLIAEVMSTRLLPATKRVINYRVAETFESDARRQRSPALWWEAATRWRDASESERALSAFCECARHAMDIGRASDAARILGEALILPLGGDLTVEAAKKLILAGDLASDTALVLRGYAVLRSCGVSDEHDEFELAARRAVLRDSQLPDRVFELTLGCLRASTATPEHRVLAATLGLKGVFVAEIGSRVAQLIEAHVSPADLSQVEDVIRLEFELLLRSANGDWDVVSTIAERLLEAAESKRPARRANIQHNCGVAFSIAGKPEAARDAWERSFESAGLARCHSQQVRVASLIAGSYADTYDDNNCDAWILRATEADAHSVGLFDNFDLPIIRICRTFVAADLANTALLLASESQRGLFSGSPTRERWGRAFALLLKSKQDPRSATEADLAETLADRQTGVVSGVRDLEIAAAANILSAHDRSAAAKLVRNYLDVERRSRQLVDRQLSETIRELQLDNTLSSDLSPHDARRRMDGEPTGAPA